MTTPFSGDPNGSFQPAQQPKKKKKWPWVVGIIVVILIIVAACGGGDETDESADLVEDTGSPTAVTNDNQDSESALDQENTETQEEEVSAEEQASTEAAVGESRESGDLTVTVSNVRFESDAIGSYVCADAVLANNSDSSARFSQFDFKLHKPNGVVADSTFTGLPIQNLESAELSAGGQTSGTVCFDGDGTPGEYKVEHSGGFFSEPITWTTAL